MSVTKPHINMQKISSVDHLAKQMKEPNKEVTFFATMDIVLLQQADMITKKEMINLYKMIRSEDQENLTVALEIIKQKIDNFKDE